MNKLSITVAFLCSFVASQIMAAQDITLTLHIDGTTFLESQAVWAHVALVNHSSAKQLVQPFVLTEDMTKGVRFILINERGDVVPQSVEGTWDDFGTSTLRTISPGDSIAQMYNILTLFSTNGASDAPPYLSTLHYLGAGSYALQAMQFSGKDSLWSNVSRVTIVEASGKEREALLALKEADSKYLRNPHDNATLRAYESFLRLHPKSSYAPLAYKSLIFLYMWPHQDKENALKNLAKLVQRFPDDDTALHQLAVYTPRVVQEGRGSLLEKLACDYPQTKVGQFSERELQRFHELR